MPKDKREGRGKYKCWCFTVYDIDHPMVFNADCAYTIYSLEKGHEEERDHFQGYVRFKIRKDKKACQNAIGRPTCHVEKARESEESNHDYCSKEDTHIDGPWETGTYDPKENKQGRRSDLDEIGAQIASGATMRQVATDHMSDFIRYHNGMYALQEVLAPPPAKEREIGILVMWGQSGVGKSHRVLTSEELGAQGIYTAPTHASDHPWDGWDSTRHKVLFMDEFRWENWPVETMNKILDKWCFQLQCRYRNKYATWEFVVLCTNQDPRSWYPNEDPMIRQALRRRLGHSCKHILERESDPADLPSDPDFDPETGN